MASKFQIGDRVRINCPLSRSGNHGRECTITGLYRGLRYIGTGETDYVVGYWVDLPGREGRGCVYNPGELVPLYDGNEPAAWSDCVWQPKKIQLGV